MGAAAIAITEQKKTEQVCCRAVDELARLMTIYN